MPRNIGGLRQLPAGVQPDWLTLSPDGKSLYLSAYNQAQVHVIDTVTNSYNTFINVCPTPMGIAFTPDGSKALVRHGQFGGDIAMIDTGTLSYNYDTTDTIGLVFGEGDIAEIHHAVVPGGNALGQHAAAVEQAFQLGTRRHVRRIASRSGKARILGSKRRGAQQQGSEPESSFQAKLIFHILLLYSRFLLLD